MRCLPEVRALVQPEARSTAGKETVPIRHLWSIFYLDNLSLDTTTHPGLPPRRRNPLPGIHAGLLRQLCTRSQRSTCVPLWPDISRSRHSLSPDSGGGRKIPGKVTLTHCRAQAGDKNSTSLLAPHRRKPALARVGRCACPGIQTAEQRVLNGDASRFLRGSIYSCATYALSTATRGDHPLPLCYATILPWPRSSHILLFSSPDLQPLTSHTATGIV
jgi:hypothetical protein